MLIVSPARVKKKQECPGYDTKLHLLVRLQFWTSGECRILF